MTETEAKTHIDIDDPNIVFRSLTVEEARVADQDDVAEKVSSWLDEAQGKIFGEAVGAKTYLVIEITR
jgi:hypothetical protein